MRPCRIVHRYQRFGGVFRLQIQCTNLKMEVVSPHPKERGRQLLRDTDTCTMVRIYRSPSVTASQYRRLTYLFAAGKHSITTNNSAPYSGEHFSDIGVKRVVSTCNCRRYVTDGLWIITVEQGWSFQTSWSNLFPRLSDTLLNTTTRRYNPEAQDTNPRHCKNLNSIALTYIIANRNSFTSYNMIIYFWIRSGKTILNFTSQTIISGRYICRWYTVVKPSLTYFMFMVPCIIIYSMK